MNFFLAGDFNDKETEPCFSEFLPSYDSKSLVRNKTYYKNPENVRYKDLFITNSICGFQKSNCGSKWLILLSFFSFLCCR